uniref:Uncharacterized protein n=1 Tax=Cannabis sativa TaxID=3483 RepID=A0A803Q6R7_CANSA
MIGTTKKDFPPPLTTSLIKQTGCLQILLTKRCHLVRRCTDDDIDIDHQNGNYVIQSDHDDDYRSQDDYEINVDADDESSAVEKLGTVSTFASSFDLIGNSY